MANDPITTVLFDLDGTLLDTAHDLHAAMNHVLAQSKLPQVEFEPFRYQVHGGTTGMLKFCLTDDISPDDYNNIRDAFLNRYHECIAVNTRFFPGIEDLLTALETQNIPWGIVTNKPGWLTTPLIEHFQLNHRSRCIIAGDTLPTRKPHPEVLLHACELIQCKPQQTVYIGDVEDDILVARRAGMAAIAANYGYHPAGHYPSDWQADVVIHSPMEVIDWLNKKGAMH